MNQWGGHHVMAMIGQRPGFFGIVLLILDIWAIVSVLQSSAGTAQKVIWVVVIVVLPLLGFLFWLLFGPRSAR